MRISDWIQTCALPILLLDHDHVVAHTRHVSTAGRRVAEDHGDGGDLAGRGPGEIAEAAATGDEDLALRREVGATGLGEVNCRPVVLGRDVGGTEVLLHLPDVGRAYCRGSGVTQ